MRAKTKIVVLHLKELIYTGIFVVLGILFVVLILVMFLPGDTKKTKETTAPVYIPGVYSTSLTLGGNTLDIEVSVDETNINSVRLVNLNETIETMYPLIESSFQELSSQITQRQSMEGITYSNDNKYTSLVLLDAIHASLEKALIPSNDAAFSDSE